MEKVRFFLIGDNAIDKFMSTVEVVNFGIRDGGYRVTYLDAEKESE